MEENLHELLARLIENKVECVVVGGFAALVHGCTLVTRDVDVAIALNPANLRKLWEALKGTRPRFRHARPPRWFSREDAQRPDWKNL